MLSFLCVLCHEPGQRWHPAAAAAGPPGGARLGGLQAPGALQLEPARLRLPECPSQGAGDGQRRLHPPERPARRRRALWKSAFRHSSPMA